MFQFLDNIGTKILKEHIGIITGIASAAKTLSDFRDSFAKNFGVEYHTTQPILSIDAN